jgi:hypothetical protein
MKNFRIEFKNTCDCLAFSFGKYNDLIDTRCGYLTILTDALGLIEGGPIDRQVCNAYLTALKTIYRDKYKLMGSDFSLLDNELGYYDNYEGGAIPPEIDASQYFTPTQKNLLDSLLAKLQETNKKAEIMAKIEKIEQELKELKASV